MSSLFNWLGDLFDFFRSLVPSLVLIRSTHKAVKFRHGHCIIPLEPGLHWYWPIVTELVEIAAARQTLNLETQVILSADGPVAASGVVVYEVRNVEQALGRSWDVEDTVSDLALARILKEIVGEPIASLTEELRSGKLRKDLTAALRKDLRRFGVFIEYCSLTDFSTCQVVKLLGAEGAAPVAIPDE